MSAQPESGAPERFRYRHRPGASGMVLDEVERWTALTLGVAEVVTSYSTSTLSQVADVEAADGVPGPGESATEQTGATGATQELNAADVVRVLPGALAVMALRAQSRAFDIITGTEAAVTSILGRLGAVRITSPFLTRVQGALADLDSEFRAEQAERAQLAATFLAAAGPRTLDELLARIDMEAVLDRVDMEAVLDRVDMEAVLDRVDMEAVLGRVDLDAVIERVDLDAVIERVDVNDFMSGVIQEIQVAGLLRDSTGAIATTTVDVLRTQVGGVANRITGRK